MKMMGELVEQHVPHVAQHLAALECPLELMLSQWLLPIFSTTFPPACTMLIWDWLFAAGSATLLMVATAFLALHQVGDAATDCNALPSRCLPAH